MTRVTANNGFTLLELIVALSITFAIATVCVSLILSADDMLDMALQQAYVLEADRTVFGFFAADLGGLVLERTTLAPQDGAFDEADFSLDDPASLVARDISLLILKRDYTDADGRARAADALFLQTTGAGAAEGDGKTNPVSRVLYCLCIDDGDGDRSNDPAVFAAAKPLDNGDGDDEEQPRLSLLRCVWYSQNAFARLALPDAAADTQPPAETLLVEDVVSLEILVLFADGAAFERRATFLPNAAETRIIAVQIVLTLREPYNGKEREIREVINLPDTECY